MEKKTNTTGDNILALSDKVEVVNSKVEENKESISKLDEKITELSTRINDFNMYTNVPEQTSDNNEIDKSKEALMGLEQKIFKKFSLTDERLKRVELSVVENKNNIANATVKLIEHDKLFNSMNEAFLKMQKDLSEQDEKHNKIICELQNKLEEKVNSLKQEIESQNKTIGDKFTLNDEAFKALQNKKEEKSIAVEERVRMTN